VLQDLNHDVIGITDIDGTVPRVVARYAYGQVLSAAVPPAGVPTSAKPPPHWLPRPLPTPPNPLPPRRYHRLSRPMTSPTPATAAASDRPRPPSAPPGLGAAATPLQRALPNTLTGLRVLMAIIVLGVLTAWRYDTSAAAAGHVDWLLVAAATLFILATLTDALDGYLARRWGTETAFGRIMDPFADKILVIGTLVFLAGPDFWYATPERHRFIGHGFQLSGLYPWMVVVVVGRELLVTSIRGVLESQGVRFGADLWGKLKMALQSVTVPLILFTIALTPTIVTPESRPPGRWLIDFAAITMVAATAASGVPYVWRALRHMAEWNDARKAA
jgi:CDP-diacylglycerol---glycerol-3-phosphate 3-phosphatidyltransferase